MYTVVSAWRLVECPHSKSPELSGYASSDATVRYYGRRLMVFSDRFNSAEISAISVFRRRINNIDGFEGFWVNVT